MSRSKASWIKKCMVKVWLLWEKIILAILQIKPVDVAKPFLKVRVRTYRGRPILLAEGEEIQKGDLILELHLNNEWLFENGIHSYSQVQFAIQMIRMTEQSLPKITHFIHHHPNREDIKGVFGVSIIHRGTKQFGFTVIDLPKGLFSFLTKIYLRFILLMVHPTGKQRLKTKTNLLVPKAMFISKKKLTEMYPIESLTALKKKSQDRPSGEFHSSGEHL